MRRKGGGYARAREIFVRKEIPSLVPSLFPVGNVCSSLTLRPQANATVLAPGKGWVLAMLAMLGPREGLCVAARGSGPGAPRGAALALHCAP